MSCYHILAPQNGKIVPISEIQDPVFSGRILGDGVGIIPSENRVLSPISGTIVQIAETFHAICIQGDSGIEILVHLGLDTVKLKGKGFTCCVKNGQHVSAGDLLMNMNIKLIRREGFDTITPCIIINMDKVKKLSVLTGNTIAGKTIIMHCQI